jgi:hypothetical protein
LGDVIGPLLGVIADGGDNQDRLGALAPLAKMQDAFACPRLNAVPGGPSGISSSHVALAIFIRLILPRLIIPFLG